MGPDGHRPHRAPLSLVARRVLLLGVRPADERGLAEPFSLLRGLAVCALLGWWLEASAAVAETGTHHTRTLSRRVFFQ